MSTTAADEPVARPRDGGESRAPAGVRGRFGRPLARLRAEVPAAAWACALVALLNGLAWSLIVPPFEVPDENAHYAYVQQIAERGTVPRHVRPEGRLSPAEDSTLGAIDFYEVVGEAHNLVPFSQLQQDALEVVQWAPLATRGDGDALSATDNPPVYYAVQAIPYKLTGGSVLDRLAVMRVVSALMGAATILLVFLFLRELLPARPWAWSAGALVAALQPLFGFMSGGVNNDDLLYLVSAGVLWSIARAFRRGLTPATGALLGAFLGVGLVSKLTLLGFVPAAALAVALLVRRGLAERRPEGGDGAASGGRLRRTPALAGAAWAAGLTVAPIAIYTLLNREVWHRTTIAGGLGVSSTGTAVHHSSLAEELSHIWQLYLPHLWMRAQFTYLPLWKTWFTGLVGRLGWLDYEFPLWVDDVALVLAIAVVALAVVELVRRRRALVARAGEAVVYVLIPLGLAGVVGVQSYRAYINGEVFEQPRYMLPLLGIYAAVIALAVRAGGPRWGRALAAALVVLAIGHDLYGQALTVARYYA
jgi:hypothetical protein